jgi:hypothetical protein
MIHVVKNTKRVFRPKTQFPSRAERGRLFKRFTVSSLRCGRVGKLFFDRRRDQPVILKLDPIQMVVRLWRIADRKCGSPRH